MKFLTLLFIIVLSACTTYPSDKKESGWPVAYSPLLDWPKRHWKGQDYQASINPESQVMRLSAKASYSMFSEGFESSPVEFIQNLKNADIIRRVYNPSIGFFWESKIADEVIVELGPNFYTLSYPDKMIITQMISRSYPQDNYLMKDWKTQKIVGQITPQGFDLF